MPPSYALLMPLKPNIDPAVQLQACSMVEVRSQVSGQLQTSVNYSALKARMALTMDRMPCRRSMLS